MGRHWAQCPRDKDNDAAPPSGARNPWMSHNMWRELLWGFVQTAQGTQGRDVEGVEMDVLGLFSSKCMEFNSGGRNPWNDYVIWTVLIIQIDWILCFSFFLSFFPFSPQSPLVRSCIFLAVGPSSCGMWDAASAWSDEQCHVRAQDSNQRNTGPPAAERANPTTRPRGQPFFDYFWKEEIVKNVWGKNMIKHCFILPPLIVLLLSSFTRSTVDCSVDFYHFLSCESYTSNTWKYFLVVRKYVVSAFIP